MEIRNAAAPMNGIPAENVFIAVDELGAQHGTGYIVYQFQPHLYPDCPMNLYFSINSKPDARYMLFGALVARARVLRESNREVRARLYTGVSIDDEAGQEFYRHNGMDCQETENLMRMQMPAVDYLPPADCQVMSVPLRTVEEQQALCARMAAFDVTWLDPGYLSQLQRMPHFAALAMVQNNVAIAELVMAGSGPSCELVALYVHPDYRGRGMAKSLIRAGMAVAQQQGVSTFCARLISRSLPQRALANAFSAQDIQVMNVFPEKYL